MKIQECPHTKFLLESATNTDDAIERRKIIDYIRSLICGNPADRKVCCCNDGYYNFPKCEGKKFIHDTL